TGNFDQVFQSWQFVASQKIRSRSKNELRDILRATLGADVDTNTEASVKGRNIVLSRMGKHDHVTGAWIPGTGAPVLIVDPGGASAALRSNLAHQVTESHRPILMIDPFRSDTKRVSRQRLDPYFLSYNRSDDAERVQDILTALAFLRSQT